MTDRPIIFSAGMIRALLAGRKSMTRRILKPQPGVVGLGGAENILTCDGGYAVAGRGKPQLMPYAVGDRLWVREAFITGFDIDDEFGCPVGDRKAWYRATDRGLTWYDPDSESTLDNPPWKPSIHMPRWASRLTLIVTDVRVQRLQDISEADAVAEGIEQARSGRFYDPTMSKSAAAHLGGMFYGPRPAFETLWNSIHGPEAWDANPWVAALTFTTHRCNIDNLPGGANG